MAETDKTNENLHAGTKRVEEEIRERGAEAGHAARETAREYAQRARDEAYARGEAYRDYAAGETGKVASALRRAAEDLAEGSPQERLVARLADQVAGAADQVRGMQIDDIYGETTHFARRHPGAFLAGAALAGFAAARFLKASGEGGGYAAAGGHPARSGEPAGATAPRSYSGYAGTTDTARPMADPTAPPASETATPAPASKQAPATDTAPVGDPLSRKST